VFAILLAPLSLLGFYNYFRHARRPDLLETALLPLGLYAILLALITSTRITILGSGLNITRWWVSKRFVPFSEIDHSDVQILAERDWPVQITIHLKQRQIVRLGLKAIQQRDAAWLCSLPELKCISHPGLTRTA
jgi:hypothetical protein